MNRASGPNGWEYEHSQAYLDNLFHNAPEAIVLLDKRNRVLRINNEFTRLFGYTQEEILGEHIDSLIAGPDTREEAASYSRIAENGQKLSAESVRYRRDGSPVHVSIMGAPVEKEGEIIGIFAIYRDISQRKRVEEKLEASERRYRELIEDAPIGIFQSSSRGHFTTLNKRAAEILGFDSIEEALANYNDLSEELYTKPFWRNSFLQKLRRYGEVKNFEARAQRRDGEIIWLTLNARISEYLDGEDFLIDGFLSDTTELKRATEQVEQSLKDKEVLLQEVHHRVKNNMQIISSILNLEADDVALPEIEDVLLSSQSRIRAMSLIHEKLYHSDDVTVVDLSDYTENLCRELVNFTAAQEESRPHLHFSFDEVFTGIDFAIPYGLIINELLINSLKHAFKEIESPEIEVKLHKRKGKIELKLSDNGVGLPRDLDVINPGTLGMQLIRSLCEQLAGELEVESEAGTVFTIRFPLP